MFRLLAATLLPLSLLWAPAPREATSSYFPTTKGAEWVYVTKGCSNEDVERVVVLTASESKDRATILTLCTRSAGGKLELYEKLRLSNNGVFRIECFGETVDPPICLLKLPAKSGNTWQEFRDDLRTRYELSGPEIVEVPAGKYRAIRVRMQIDALKLGGSVVPQTSWYAPGVGLVKRVDVGEPMELKSFKPGK